MDERLFYRVHEAAELCAVGRSKMYELVSSGIVPSIRIGRAVRVPAESLQKWASRQQQVAEQSETPTEL